MLSQDDIKLVVIVNKFGSISKASKILYLSQSTLSRRIQEIEKELGYKIFERGKGKKIIELTEKGSKLIPLLRQIQNLHTDAKNIRESNTNPKLKIASSDGPYNLIINEMIIDLYKENPEWEFKLKSLSYRECMEVLSDGIVDIAFVGNNIYKKDLNTVPLYSEEMVFVCLKGEKYSEPVIPEKLDLKKSVYSPYSSEFSSWFRRTFENKPPLIRCDLIVQVVEFMKHLNLWSIVPVSVAEYLSEFVDIETYEMAGNVPERIIYYAVKNGEISENINKITEMINMKLENRRGIHLFKK